MGDLEGVETDGKMCPAAALQELAVLTVEENYVIKK
jgi:hypothetical protein